MKEGRRWRISDRRRKIGKGKSRVRGDMGDSKGEDRSRGRNKSKVGRGRERGSRTKKRNDVRDKGERRVMMELTKLSPLFMFRKLL